MLRVEAVYDERIIHRHAPIAECLTDDQRGIYEAIGDVAVDLIEKHSSDYKMLPVGFLVWLNEEQTIGYPFIYWDAHLAAE